MTDQLAEALELTEDEFWYPNEQVILDAAREHLSCSTITEAPIGLLDGATTIGDAVELTVSMNREEGAELFRQGGEVRLVRVKGIEEVQK